MNFKDKLLEQLSREDLADNEAKVNAIIEAVGDFVPKGTYNNLSKVKQAVESERDDAIAKLKTAEMTAEEKAVQKMQDLIKSVEEREKRANIKENSAEAREILIGAGLSKEDLESGDFLTSIVSEDREVTISRANSLASMFKAQESAVEKRVKDTYYKTNPQPPASDSKDKTVTKEELNKMTYSEEIKFAQENPALYAELLK